MKRQALIHDRVFAKPEFASEYAKKHESMGRRLGKMVVGKDLKARGFAGGAILDAGCGPGFMLIELLKLFPEATGMGVDLAEPLLDVARAAAKSEGLSSRVNFESADVERLPYDNQSFDAVVSTNMLHIVENPVKQLDEIERVLKPGGICFIADIKRSLWISLFEKVSRTAFTKKEAGEIIAQSNIRKGQLSDGFIWWQYKA